VRVHYVDWSAEKGMFLIGLAVPRQEAQFETMDVTQGMVFSMDDLNQQLAAQLGGGQALVALPPGAMVPGLQMAYAGQQAFQLQTAADGSSYIVAPTAGGSVMLQGGMPFYTVGADGQTYLVQDPSALAAGQQVVIGADGQPQVVVSVDPSAAADPAQQAATSEAITVALQQQAAAFQALQASGQVDAATLAVLQAQQAQALAVMAAVASTGHEVGGSLQGGSVVDPQLAAAIEAAQQAAMAQQLAAQQQGAEVMAGGAAQGEGMGGHALDGAQQQVGLDPQQLVLG